MKYFSMFTGVGGFEIGIQNSFIQQRQNRKEDNSSHEERGEHSERAKWQSEPVCVGVCEIDKFACKVLKKRFPEVHNYGDAKEINTERLPDFDLLVGGFPCQSFSIAGGRKGFSDTRGTLFREVARVARDKRPEYLLLENVKGLVNHEKGKTLSVILSTFQELGYSLEWGVVNSRYFGVPQNRERIFIIGCLGGGSPRKVFPQLGANKEDSRTNQVVHNSLTEAIGRSGSSKEFLSSLQKVADAQGVAIADYRNDEGLRIRKESISPTLSARKHSETDVSTMPHFVSDDFRNSRIRRLTPRECERLQGFPRDWTKYGIEEDGTEVEISDTQRYKMMGNAVTTSVVQAIVGKLF